MDLSILYNFCRKNTPKIVHQTYYAVYKHNLVCYSYVSMLCFSGENPNHRQTADSAGDSHTIIIITIIITIQTTKYDDLLL